jgi:rhodanese-related sulfurtransferase
MLRRRGYQNVKALRGGFYAWQAAGHPVEVGAPAGG